MKLLISVLFLIIFINLTKTREINILPKNYVSNLRHKRSNEEHKFLTKEQNKNTSYSDTSELFENSFQNAEKTGSKVKEEKIKINKPDEQRLKILTENIHKDLKPVSKTEKKVEESVKINHRSDLENTKEIVNRINANIYAETNPILTEIEAIEEELLIKEDENIETETTIVTENSYSESSDGLSLETNIQSSEEFNETNEEFETISPVQKQENAIELTTPLVENETTPKFLELLDSKNIFNKHLTNESDGTSFRWPGTKNTTKTKNKQPNIIFILADDMVSNLNTEIYEI